MSKHTHSNQHTQNKPPKSNHPRFPPGPYRIIYIRGFTLGLEAIQATTETPFMGFNLGSTKHRQAFDGQARRLIFPSPLIRLRQDHGHTPTDIDPHTLYHANTDSAHPSTQQVANQNLPNKTAQCIIINRDYIRADPDFHRAYPANEPLKPQAPTNPEAPTHPSDKPDPTPPPSSKPPMTSKP